MTETVVEGAQDSHQDTQSLFQTFIQRYQSKRELKDLIFKVILALAIIIILAPFFMVLFQIGSIGFWQIFGTEPGQGFIFRRQPVVR